MNKRNEFYCDGITRATAPFWMIECKTCGHKGLAALYKEKCSKCGADVTCIPVSEKST